MGAQNRVKKTNGEILRVSQLPERNTRQIKNFGMVIRYDSRSNTHTMYKEYRDVSLSGAVTQMYTELASRHRARKSSIQIVSANQIKECKRPITLQFLTNKIKFPLPHRIPRPSEKKYQNVFKYVRPDTYNQ